MLFAPATCPQTYIQLLARSFNLYIHAFKRTFIFSLLFAVVIFTPRLMSIFLNQPIQSILNISLSHPYQLLLIVIYLASLWFFAAIYWRIHCVAINRHESFVEDFKTAAKKILYLVGAAFIIFLITYLLTWMIILCHWVLIYFSVPQQKTIASSTMIFLTLFIPSFIAFYVATLFIFYFPLIVLENDRIFMALKQSLILVWGNVWRTFSCQITPWIFFLVALIIVKMIFKISVYVYFISFDQMPSLSVVILQLIMLAIFVPWSISAMIVQLQDLELRKTVANQK